MIKLSLDHICRAVDGKLISHKGTNGEAPCVDRVTIDSRQVSKGDLFIPIVGENFDGHDFILKAMEEAQASFCESSKVPQVLTGLEGQGWEGKYIIEVEDTLEAFHKLGTLILKVLDIPAVGVTGSVGKTTTKEMIASVLEMKYKVHKNKGNFNNLIGLPLTLCDLELDHEIVVLEMGMDRFGEIHDLTNMVKPSCGVITNIGISHIEYLGSREGILKAKMEIVDSFDETSTLIINGDDDLLATINRDTDYSIVTCGLEAHNDIYVKNYKISDNKTYGYDAVTEHGPLEVQLAIHGIHNISNSLLAVAVGQKFGVTEPMIAEGLNRYHASGRRMNIYELNEKITVINDTYNAVTDSMIAGCKVLTSFEDTYKIAVLGDMLELGSISETEHEKIGDYCANADIQALYYIGDEMKYAHKSTQACMTKKKSKVEINAHFNEMNQLNKALLKDLSESQKKITVYVKGSLGMKMDRVIEMLEALNENLTDSIK